MATQLPTGNLQPSQTYNAAVVQLQQYLIENGYLSATDVGNNWGYYGAKTTAAVKALQDKLGVNYGSDAGFYGPLTRDAVNKAATTNTQTQTPQNQTQTTQTNPPGTFVTPSGAVVDAAGNMISGPTNTPTSTSNSTSNPINPVTPGFVENYSQPGDTQSSLYGQTQRNSDWEGPNITTEKNVAEAAGSAGMISSSFLSTIAADPSLVGFYVNALTYGGYTVGDILNDMKRRELISQGNEQAKTLKIIDPEVNRMTYMATPEGQKATLDASTMIPTFNFQGLMNPEILKYGANMPDDLFKSLVPLQDKTSQEFKDAVAQIKATMYDLSSAQLQASTEQEKAIADYNQQQFKDQIEKQYGIALSNDATEAWKQIEGLEETYNQRGISGSGMQNEAVDDYLKTVRKQDQRMRDEKLTKEDQNKAAYYRSSASAAEIAALTPEEKAKYGLTPSAEILNAFSIATLKQKFPAWTDEMIKAAHDALIDENGNYRSTLYNKYYSGLSTNTANMESVAENTVMQDALNKDAKEKAAYDQSQALNIQPVKKLIEPVANPNTSTPTPAATNTQTPASSTPNTSTGSTSMEPTQAQLDARIRDSGGTVAPSTSTSGSLTAEQSASMTAQLKAASDAVAAIQKSMGGGTSTVPVAPTPVSNPSPITTPTTTSTARDYSPLKPGEDINSYYKRIGIPGY